MSENDDETAPLERPNRTRRERLIDAARARFFKLGYAETRMLDVARDAGFSKRTVYLEFESKDELFATICEEGVEILLGKLRTADVPDDPVLDVLVGMARAYLSFYHEHHDYFRLLFTVATDENLAKAPPEAFERLRQRETACVECIARHMARARDQGLMRAEVQPWKNAVMAWAALTGCLTANENGRRVELAGVSIEAMYWSCLDALMRGVSTEEALKSA